MNIESLYAELSTNDSHLAHLQQADHPGYEVVVAKDYGMGPDAQIYDDVELEWDHNQRRLIIKVGD